MIMPFLKKLFERIAQLWRNPSPSTATILRSGVEVSPQQIKLLSIVKGNRIYVGLDDVGTLRWSPQPDSDLNMFQYETGTPKVVKFSNIRSDFYLIGQLEGSNVVRGENHLFNGAEFWHIRDHPNPQNILLQFYGNSVQNQNWQEFGWFFIINVDGGNLTFDLGDYNTALEKGIFQIDT